MPTRSDVMCHASCPHGHGTIERVSGPALVSARQHARVTLRALAALVRVSPQHLCDIENDRRQPSPELLERILSALS